MSRTKRLARILLTLLTSAGLAVAGCSWHRFGEADAVAPPPAELPAPAAGLSLADTLGVAEARESGELSAEAEVLRVARVADGIWEDLPVRRVRKGELALGAGADTVVVVKRTCSDWQGRERWSDERASWFLLSDGALAAYDHWTFGPRCALGNAFRPVGAEAPARATERDLLRWLEQRHPPGSIPAAIRLQRGLAYVGAGRLDEARATLRFVDDALDGREHLFAARESTEEERAAFEAEGQRLRELRGDLSFAIREAEADARAR